MTNTTNFQITLGSGNCSVVVTTDRMELTAQTLAWATSTYDHLVERYGGAEPAGLTKAKPSHEAEATPVCPTHNTQMASVTGRRGPFFSCHQRNSDSTFCTQKADAK